MICLMTAVVLMAISSSTFATADGCPCLMATTTMAVTATRADLSLRPTNLDWDCSCWGAFGRVTRHSPATLVLLSFAISCDDFGTKKVKEEGS